MKNTNEQNELIILTLETEKDNVIEKQEFVVYCTFSVREHDYVALIRKDALEAENEAEEEIEVQFMRYTITDDNVMDIIEITDDSEFDDVYQEFCNIEQGDDAHDNS